MKDALRLAKKSADEGEVPVGCVIVCGDKIVGRGRNRRETKKTALSHAEIEAIGKACKALGGWRLHECDLYVTLEPCPMCAGAIVNARIRTVYYGADDPKAGACGSVVNLFELGFNHKPELVRGLLRDECSGVLTDFFRRLRKQRRQQSKQRKESAGDPSADLCVIPGVGDDLKQHLNRLGIRTVGDLRGRDPQQMYEQDCEQCGGTVDRCVLFVYRLAVYFAENEIHETQKLRWWYWKNREYPPKD